MKLYRIYTERTGKLADKAEREVQKTFEGYTRIDGTGIWRGAREKSVVFEILTHGNAVVDAEIRDLAARIRDFNEQDSVLVTAQEVEAVFV